VIEDYCRFALDDRHLTQRCKQLRHDLVTALEEVSTPSLAAARESQTDVGADVATPQEGERSSLVHVAAASWQRVQQALRVIDEAGGGPLLIINDRVDLAVLARADGVHIGQDELTIRDARRIVGPEMLVGVSTHNIEQARQAVLDGANYLGCGPVFPSSTKQFKRFPGVNFLKQVAAEISLPAFAFGGVKATNLSRVLATGFSRIAYG